MRPPGVQLHREGAHVMCLPRQRHTLPEASEGGGQAFQPAAHCLRRGPPTTCPALPQRAEEGAAGGRTLGCGRAPGALQVQGTRASPPQTCLHWASQGLTGHSPARRRRDRRNSLRMLERGRPPMGAPRVRGLGPRLSSACRQHRAGPRPGPVRPGWTRAGPGPRRARPESGWPLVQPPWLTDDGAVPAGELRHAASSSPADVHWPQTLLSPHGHASPDGDLWPPLALTPHRRAELGFWTLPCPVESL